MSSDRRFCKGVGGRIEICFFYSIFSCGNTKNVGSMSCTNSGVREKNKKKKIFFLLHVVRSEKSSKNTCFFELQKCAKHRKKGGPHLPLLGDPPIYTVFKMPPAHSDFLAPTHQEIFAKISSSSSVAKKIFMISKKKFYFFFQRKKCFF